MSHGTRRIHPVPVNRKWDAFAMRIVLRMQDEKTGSPVTRWVLSNDRNFPSAGKHGKLLQLRNRSDRIDSDQHDRDAPAACTTMKRSGFARWSPGTTYATTASIRTPIHNHDAHSRTTEQIDICTYYTRALLVYTFTKRTTRTDTPQQRLLFFRNTRFLHSPARESVYERARCRRTRGLYSERHQPKNKATFNLRAWLHVFLSYDRN